MDINEYDNPDFTSNISRFNRQDSSASNLLDQSITGTGLSNLIKDANRKQKRNESRILRQKQRGNTPHKDKDARSQRSINYDSDGDDYQDRSMSAFSKNSFF